MKKLLMALSLIFLVVLAACSPRPTVTSSVELRDERLPPTPMAPSKPAWQERWTDTVKAAQKEGKVVFITRFSPGLITALGGAFKENYGVDIEFIVAAVPELQPKITRERQAGLYLQDVVQAGVPSHRELKKVDMLAPMEPQLILPEVIDPHAWLDKKLPFWDEHGSIFMFFSRVGPTIVANSQLVKPEDIKSWRDLLEPKWKGKIVLFDPTVSGPSQTVMAHLLEEIGIDYLRELAKQELIINRDRRLQVEWVARGKYPVGIGFDFTIMEEMREAGAPIVHMVPSEGSHFGSATGAIALFNRPAHPNAARLFLNWFLSREPQALIAREAKEQSRRADVPSALAPDRQFKSGIKYSNSDTEEFQYKSEQMRDVVWKEIFAGGSK